MRVIVCLEAPAQRGEHAGAAGCLPESRVLASLLLIFPDPDMISFYDSSQNDLPGLSFKI